jgi:hypothetical protein
MVRQRKISFGFFTNVEDVYGWTEVDFNSFDRVFIKKFRLG